MKLEQWAPSDKQRECAEYLATGYSQLRTSQLIGVDDRTVRRWWTDERYRDYVRQIREELMASQRPLFESTVAISQTLVFGALTGEYDTDDPRVQLAAKILDRTVWRIVEPGHTPQVSAAPDYPALPAPGTA